MKSIFYLLTISLFIFSCNRINKSSERPNILFCIADDASFPHMGAYGTDWIRTPGFDRIANEGILFTRCYTPNAKCAPSRSCIITGRNSWQLEEASCHWPYFPTKFKTYAESLIDNGYHVGFTAKGWAPGIAFTNDGEKRDLLGKAYNQHKLTPPTNGISNIDYSENFKAFLSDKKNGQPFCFWYGSNEPHRAYEFKTGIEKGGKTTEEIDKVFNFWPDNDSVRSDMLDYAYEIEHFDFHLSKILSILEENGELDNTVIVVTADNGMPFPRIKGQEYEYSNHLPLAIRWGKGIKNPGRIVNDYVNFIDFAPTFLGLAGISREESGMQPITGKSLTDIFYSGKDGIINQERDHVLIGKERHDVGRPNDFGYPIRGIFKDNYLYLENFEPARWPAGNPETGYLNTDGSPTKSVILNMRRSGENTEYWQMNFGMRPSEEFYKVDEDPECMNNLAQDENLQSLKEELKAQLRKELTEQKDPRLTGNAEYFDQIEYADTTSVNFYERYMAGEKLKAGWVNNSDFEKEPIE